MSETVVVRDPGALEAAGEVFQRRPAPFGPADLAALAKADPEHDRRLDPAYREAVVPFYASSVLGERAAAAYASWASVVGLPSLRGGFTVQAGDEERHAALDEARLALFDIDPAHAGRITPGVAREMQEALAVTDPLRRMFLTNVIGETSLAAAAFPFVIALARANGDRLSVALNRARLADEGRHVRFAVRTFEILLAQEPANRGVVQRWQDEHLASGHGAFLLEVVPALEAAPNRPAGDWLGAALDAYRRTARHLGLRPP